MADHAGDCYTKDLLLVRVTTCFIGLSWSKRPLWSPHLNVWELTFGWLGVGNLPPIKCWFHRWLCMGSHTAPADHLTLHLQIYPPSNADFTDDCVWDLTLYLQITLHCTCRSIPPSNGNFTDSCSGSSYFIPTLRAHIWPTRCWQIYPPSQILISQMIVYGIPHYTCRAPYTVPAVLPPIQWQFNRFLLWHLMFHSYSESSYLAEQVLADLPPSKWWFQIPDLGRPTPHWMAISQIPALTAHISFLLCEFIFGRPGVGRSNPLKW